MSPEKKIREALYKLDINATDKQINLWIEYLLLLEKWNKVYSMTAIKKFEDMLIKHVFDSLSIAKYLKGNSTIDVGTGAGLPGIVLAILFPKCKFTLIDSVGKKIIFLQNVKRILNLENIKLVNTRVEKFNGKFDNIISRALTSVDDFYNLCKHLLNDNNQMLAMKGFDTEEANLVKLQLEVETHQVTVPFLRSKRSLIVMKKRMSNNKFMENAYKKVLFNLSGEVKLLAVSKCQSLETIKHLASLGQNNFGESYLQELEQKVTYLPDLNWHFIGSIQSKKLKHIVKYVSVIQSIEKFEHIRKISKYAKELDKQISVFLQINIDDDFKKSGFNSDQIDEVVDCIKSTGELENVTVSGLMCLPAKNNNPRISFKKMYKFYMKVNSMIDDSLKLNELSMGMSRDYIEAINFGSTMVRIGSSLFNGEG